MTRFFGALAVALLAAACGGGGSGGNTPSAPSSTAPPSNRNPVITNVAVTPTFAVAWLGTFSFSATASDPDGDSLTYSWNLGGTSATGQTTDGWTWPCPGYTGTVQVTVSDGRGGSAVAASPTFTAGCLSGTWVGTSATVSGWSFTLVLSQSQTGLVTGSYSDNWGGYGTHDPAQPGWIRSDAQLEFRTKLSMGRYSDFTFRGTMDSSGRKLNGNVTGSGFNDPFTATKQ